MQSGGALITNYGIHICSMFEQQYPHDILDRASSLEVRGLRPRCRRKRTWILAAWAFAFAPLSSRIFDELCISSDDCCGGAHSGFFLGLGH